MCGRYVISQKIEVLEKEFNAQVDEKESYKPNYNVSIGQEAPVITNEKPDKIQLFRFGMIPFWAKNKMALFNARAEGDFNKEDNPEFEGAKGIITKPAFRKPIRSQRCLVIADCFIEGTLDKGLDEPYLIYLPGRRPFAIAGIWDEWIDNLTGEKIDSFSIITVVANSLIQKIPHKRMPVILSKSTERKWLNSKTPLADITKLLVPYPSDKMNAFSISKEIKNSKNNSVDLLKPIGERLQPEVEIKVTKKLDLYGMGQYKHKPI